MLFCSIVTIVCYYLHSYVISYVVVRYYKNKKAGIMMKRKSLVLAAVMAACATSFAFATPQTQWE